MEPGDYIIKPLKNAEHEANIWRITGVYYGALKHQDMVGLVPINRKPGNAGGADISEMLVPMELVTDYLVEARHAR